MSHLLLSPEQHVSELILRDSNPWTSLARARLQLDVISTPDYCLRLTKDIKDIEDVLILVKGQLNSVQPMTAVLPSEVLSHIFCYLRDNAWDQRQKRCWIQVTHVSRHWRTTALACPELWTYLNTSSLPPCLWFIALSRARSLPLHFHVVSTNSSRSASESVASVIQSYGNRIESLSIRDVSKVPTTFGHLYQQCTQQPLPMLRELWLFRSPVSMRRPARTLPGDLFPSVTRLTISQTPFSWSSPIFDRLTFLCLEHLQMEASDIDQLFSRMQLLGSINLCDVLIRKGSPGAIISHLPTPTPPSLVSPKLPTFLSLTPPPSLTSFNLLVNQTEQSGFVPYVLPSPALWIQIDFTSLTSFTTQRIPPVFSCCALTPNIPVKAYEFRTGPQAYIQAGV
jgi:hypothetical protein